MTAFVLGMHRSGTSALTNLLCSMGFYFGAENEGIGASPENMKGFWERKDVRKVNDFILHSQGCEWNQIAAFVPEKINTAVGSPCVKEAGLILLKKVSDSPWVIKDPRLCLTFNCWLKVASAPVGVFIIRDPVEVAWSLKTRNGIPLNIGCALWEKYNYCALSLSQAIPTCFILHQTLIFEPMRVVEMLGQFFIQNGLANFKNPTREACEKLIDKKLYHQRLASNADHRPDITISQNDLLHYFLETKPYKILEKYRQLPNSCSLVLQQYEERIKLQKQLEQFNKNAERVMAKEKVIATNKYGVNKIDFLKIKRDSFYYCDQFEKSADFSFQILNISPEKQDFLQTYKVGLGFQKKGENQKALNLYSSLLEYKGIDPELLSWIFFKIGEISLQQGQSDEAAIFIRHALAHNPHHTKALIYNYAPDEELHISFKDFADGCSYNLLVDFDLSDCSLWEYYFDRRRPDQIFLNLKNSTAKSLYSILENAKNSIRKFGVVYCLAREAHSTIICDMADTEWEVKADKDDTESGILKFRAVMRKEK